MSSDSRRHLTIGELISSDGGSIKTGPFGTVLKASEYTAEGVPLISVREIGHGMFHVDERTPRVNAATTSRLPEYLLEEGDIVFARKGGIERCALVGMKQAGWFLGSDGIRLRPPKTCDARFLAASLQTVAVKEWLIQNSTGSTMASLNQGTVARLPISLPGIKEQVRVADILSALGDRIILLRETNTTLEALAQALFKSWFVDFDPVRAKLAGRVPEGMDDATTALFPDCFDGFEAGATPNGWKKLPFTDTVHVIGGGTPKTTIEEYWNGPIPWFSVVDAPLTTDVFVVNTKKSITQAGLENSSTKLLPEGTTIISARGTVGRLALVGREMTMNQSCYALRGKSDDAYFTYFSTYRLVESLKQRSHGSVFDTITTETLRSVYVIYPPAAVIDAFEKTVEACMVKIKNNLMHAQLLVDVRDTLLPRLISGQLRLPEAETILEEAIA